MSWTPVRAPRFIVPWSNALFNCSMGARRGDCGAAALIAARVGDVRRELESRPRYGCLVQSESEIEEVRVCCPDDLCTGALDATGLCGTCGRLFSQYARSSDDSDVAPTSGPESIAENLDDSPVAAEMAASERGEEEASEGGGAEVERECCPNDLCTGVLDHGGVCGTCGQTAATFAATAG
jgi:hypothetical protein